MSLQLDATIDDRDVDVSLEVADGETVAILGPNGAGKSTGPRRDRGSPAARRRPGDPRRRDAVRPRAGVWQPAHARGTALLAQDPLLFPHLTVVDNVAFGPRSAGRTRSQSRADCRRPGSTRSTPPTSRHRKPSELSGGQAQRIAVARALAAEPRLLLLDEPMAALDITVVPAMRQVLKRVLAGRSAIIVTHDVLDALLLADRVIVMEGGRIVEEGPTRDVLERPRSQFGAGIAGLNLMRGRRGRRCRAYAVGHRDRGACPTQPVPDGAPRWRCSTPARSAVYLEPPGRQPAQRVRRRRSSSWSRTARRFAYAPRSSAPT